MTIYNLLLYITYYTYMSCMYIYVCHVLSAFSFQCKIYCCIIMSGVRETSKLSAVLLVSAALYNSIVIDVVKASACTPLRAVKYRTLR